VIRRVRDESAPGRPRVVYLRCDHDGCAEASPAVRRTGEYADRFRATTEALEQARARGWVRT